MAETAPPPWHNLSSDEVFARLGSRPEGLDAAEVAQKLEAHGPNVLTRVATEGPLRILWRQIHNPLIWVLLASAVVAILVGKVTDGFVVLAVVVLNALIGFVQEYRASRAVEALRGMVPEHAAVLRSGKRVEVPVAELVPGDVVQLASGDKVPADLRLFATRTLKIDEAALTGESVAVDKGTGAVAEDAPLGDRFCVAFKGTLVAYGTGTGLVVATGDRTELGRISTLLAQTTALDTPLTRALGRIGAVISLAVVIVSAAILAVGVVRATNAGLPLGEALRETLLFAIALAVGAIPEGLPAIVTIALAIGVQRMAERRAIVRRLPAVETLGSTTVICSDKTGTLTRNEMTAVATFVPGEGVWHIEGVGYAPFGAFRVEGARDTSAPSEPVRRLLAAAALCSDATLHHDDEGYRITGDPTEAALVVAAEKAGIAVDPLRAAHPRRDAVPFESERQYMATLHVDEDGRARLLVKGAPEVVQRHALAGEDARGPRTAVERFATQGMRVLAVAEKELPPGTSSVSEQDAEEGLRLLGVIGMIDPPRPESIAAVAACRSAGIAVKMITGDHRTTALAIGKELGLPGDTAVEGRKLAAMDNVELGEAAAEVSVFARVAPEHKLKLVRVLEERGQVVAMTGDGVNDAPALKQANIGVAMGITGTSVAKEAADVVLTDDDFATIVAAVEEGRRVYDNLVKSLAFVLPTNLGLALILVFAVLFLPFDPVTRLLLLPIEPRQILWINLVATVALALPLAFEAKEPDVMRRGPRDPDEPILSRFVVRRTVLAAVLMTAAAVGLFLFVLDRGGNDPETLARAQTMAVTSVIFFQIFYVLTCRSLRDSIFRIGLFTNPYIYLGIVVLLGLQAAFVYAPPLAETFLTTPLTGREVALCVLSGLVVQPIIFLEKWLMSRARRRRTLRLEHA